MGFVEITKKEYIENLNRFKNIPFFQIPKMIDFLEKRNYQVKIYAYIVNDEIEVMSFVFFSRMFGGLRGEINSGPLVRNDKYVEKFFVHLKSELKKINCLEFVYKPIFSDSYYDSSGTLIKNNKINWIHILKKIDFKHDGLYSGYKDNEASWYYLKNLDTDINELFKSFNKNSQRNIKNAQNLGVEIRTITSESEIPMFKNIIELTGKRQGFEDKNLDYYITLFKTMGDSAEFLIAELNVKLALENIEKKINKLLSDSKVTEAQIDKLKRQKIEFESLILQRNNKIALSCMLLIYSPTETTYLFGGSITQFQKYSGQFLIQYEAMKRSIQKRIYRYNFLGIEGNFNGRDGVLRFKQNFNGFIERKYGIFRYHPRPIKYFFINLLKKLKNYFLYIKNEEKML